VVAPRVRPLSIRGLCAYHGNTTLSPMLIYSDNPFDATNPLCQDGNNPQRHLRW